MTTDNSNSLVWDEEDDDGVIVAPPPSLGAPPRLGSPSLGSQSLVEEMSNTGSEVAHPPAFNANASPSILAVTGDDDDPNKLAIVQRDANGVDSRTVIDFSSPELTRDEAQALTEHIRASTNVLYILIKRAHAGKAWKSLGYSSFKDYVKEEFNLSRSHAYRLLDQATIIEAVQAVIPAGTEVTLSVTAANTLKQSLPEFIEQAQNRTEGLSPEEAAEVVQGIADDFQSDGKYSPFRESEGGFGDASDPYGDYDGEGGRPGGNYPQQQGEFQDGFQGDGQYGGNRPPQAPSEFDFTEPYFDNEDDYDDADFDPSDQYDAEERVKSLDELYTLIQAVKGVAKAAEGSSLQTLLPFLPADLEESFSEFVQISKLFMPTLQEQLEEYLANKPKEALVEYDEDEEGGVF